LQRLSQHRRKSALFTDQKRTHGIGYAEVMQKSPEKQRVQVARVFLDVDSENLKGVSTAKPSDLGYYESASTQPTVGLTRPRRCATWH